VQGDFHLIAGQRFNSIASAVFPAEVSGLDEHRNKVLLLVKLERLLRNECIRPRQDNVRRIRVVVEPKTAATDDTSGILRQIASRLETKQGSGGGWFNSSLRFLCRAEIP